MYTAIIEDTEKNTTIFKETYDNIDTCLNRLMCTIYADIGNGGMSAEKKDGSIGSFWRCADEVYDVLRNGGIEYYADRKFYISTEDEDLNKLIALLSECDVKKFSNKRESLEEYFMKFYKEDKDFGGAL